MAASTAPRRGPRLAALAALLATLLLRAPALGLPLEGDPVAHAALARSLARGEGYALDGAPHDRLPPLWAGLVALPVALGAPAGTSARVLAWALSGLASGLLVLFGMRVTRGRVAPALLATLAALHPALATYLGGVAAGPDALAWVLWLAALSGVGVGGRVLPRLALLAAGLLPLVRVEGLGIAAAHWALARPATGGPAASRRGALLLAGCAFLPALAWAARTWIVSGGPWGTSWAGSLPSLGRLPGNLLVLLGLVLPALGLGVLWLTIPGGFLALLRARPPERALWRAAWAGAGAALLVGVLFGAAAPSGDRPLPFDASSLPVGLFALPVLVVAGLHGLALAPTRLRPALGAVLLTLTVPLGLVTTWAAAQRALPWGPRTAGRLAALADAFDATVAQAGPSDWIALDLRPSAVEGAEVLLGERAPHRRVGVVAASSAWPRGAFPRPPQLPLVDGLPKTDQALLLTDRTLEGLVYTGDRPEARVGGQGIFHRAFLREFPAGRAGTLTLHSLRRPP